MSKVSCFPIGLLSEAEYQLSIPGESWASGRIVFQFSYNKKIT